MKKARFSTGILLLMVLISISALASTHFAEQPSNQQSFIYDVDGYKIYDFDFARIVSRCAKASGFSNMTFVFSQCHSGGMLDDLRDSLTGTGDIALLSACRYDETAIIKWKTPNGFSNQVSYFTELIAEGLSLSGEYALNMREIAERAQAHNPYPSDQTYQWIFLGKGGDIYLIEKSIPANRRFALLFVGESLSKSSVVKRELKHISEVLFDRGFLRKNVVILASESSQTAPGADGPGTREALVQALKNIFESQMGPDASFFFWTVGHGDRQ